VKRFVAILATSVAAAGLTSCATFNRNSVAARAGHNELTQKAAQRLIKDADPENTGAQMRSQLTSWIRLAAVADSKGMTLDQFDQQNRAEYEKGLAGGGPVCAQAIVVTNMGATTAVMDALNSGTSFDDAFGQFNQLQDLIPTGGVIQGPDGKDCVAANVLPKDLADALKTGTVGQPFAYDFKTFAAVLLLRPYADVRAAVALAGLDELEVAQALKDSGVWVDSRYGAWNPQSQSVEPLRS
jgi:hypothetical protein